jgi:hypothetical protein
MIKDECLGSLFDDIEYMAEYISIARRSRDVRVWLNSKSEMVCSVAEEAPERPSEYVVGTYGVECNAEEIRQDLAAFRNDRASSATLF